MKYLFERLLFRVKKGEYLTVLKLIIKFFTSSGKINLDILDLDHKSLEKLFFIFGTDKSNFDGKKTFYKIYKEKENREKYPNYLSWIKRKNPYDFEYEMGLNYAPVYQKHLENLKDKSLKILELGVAGGHSLAAWYKFFPNSRIFGVDIKSEKFLMYEGKRLKYFKLDCLNQSQIQNFINENGKFDIIVDDSMHEHPFFETNLLNFFKALNNKGYYFLEDFRLADEQLQSIKDYNKKNNKKLMLNDTTMSDIFKKISKKEYFENKILDKNFQTYLFENIETVEVHYPDHPSAGICVLKKI